MNSSNTILIGSLLVVLLILGYVIWDTNTHTRVLPNSILPTPINTTVYACDKGKHISAAYFDGGQASTTPDGAPVPTGRVEVSLDGQASTTLAQTLSADGARYANSDESLVFWNKGNEALIMRSNVMDLDYTNCTAH